MSITPRRYPDVDDMHEAFSHREQGFYDQLYISIRNRDAVNVALTMSTFAFL